MAGFRPIEVLLQRLHDWQKVKCNVLAKLFRDGLLVTVRPWLALPARPSNDGLANESGVDHQGIIDARSWRWTVGEDVDSAAPEVGQRVRLL